MRRREAALLEDSIPDTVTLRGRNHRHDGVARETLPHKSTLNCHGRKYDLRDLESLGHRRSSGAIRVDRESVSGSNFGTEDVRLVDSRKQYRESQSGAVRASDRSVRDVVCHGRCGKSLCGK